MAEHQLLTLDWQTTTGLSADMYVLTPNATNVTDPAVASATSINASRATPHYAEDAGPGRYYVVVHRTAGSGNYYTISFSLTSNRSFGLSAYSGAFHEYMDAARSNDRWTLWVKRGRTVTIDLYDPSGTADNFDIYLYTDDGTGMPSSTPVGGNTSTGDHTTMTFGPTWGSSDFTPLYLRIQRFSGSGPYTVSWTVDHYPALYDRISGADRFQVNSELIVYTRYPYYEHTSDVIVASGDDAAMADPLTASGLCWAYNAPLLLVSKNASKNEEQLIRLDDMAHFNGNTGSHPFKVHVVGGAASIPTTVYNSIAAAVGGASHVERISGATRYDVAKNIALRMRNVRSDQRGRVLFANGADPDKYFDALALSAITAKNGMPILLVQKDSVPAATTSALSQLTGTTAPRFVAGTATGEPGLLGHRR